MGSQAHGRSACRALAAPRSSLHALLQHRNGCSQLSSVPAAQTLVVISLDPPIRKGQTFYNHILCQASFSSLKKILGNHVCQAEQEPAARTGGVGRCTVPSANPLPPASLASSSSSPCRPVQFPSDEEAEVELDISDEALAAKNEKVRSCHLLRRQGGALTKAFPACRGAARFLRHFSAPAAPDLALTDG